MNNAPKLASWASDSGKDEYGYWASLLVNNTSQCFRWINPGEFIMGSADNEFERGYDEISHRVSLTMGYWLADTVCTQELWQTIMQTNPSKFLAKQRPVEQISWNDANVFIGKLNNLARAKFKLPTEAQWEYACRAGTRTPFSFGNSIDSGQVNFDGNYPYNKSAKSEYREETIVVKELVANAWGFYQMHGNVWEWCADWYGNYDVSEKIAVNPRGPKIGEYRILRGGSWVYDSSYCRSAERGKNLPDFDRFSYGFRLCSDLE